MLLSSAVLLNLVALFTEAQHGPQGPGIQPCELRIPDVKQGDDKELTRFLCRQDVKQRGGREVWIVLLAGRSPAPCAGVYSAGG